MAHRGLDRCASLLANIMDGPQDSDQGNRAKVKSSTVKGARSKKKKKQGVAVSPTSNRGKARRKTAASRSTGPEKQNKSDAPAEREKNRKGYQTTYHPELASSTPQGKKSCPSQVQSSRLVRSQQGMESKTVTAQGQVHPIVKTRPKSMDYYIDLGKTAAGHMWSDSCGEERYDPGPARQSSVYPPSDGFNHGLYAGQMIPERETNQLQEARCQGSCHMGRREPQGYEEDGRGIDQDVACGHDQALSARMDLPVNANVHHHILGQGCDIPRKIASQEISAGMDHPRRNDAHSRNQDLVGSAHEQQQDVLEGSHPGEGPVPSRHGRTNDRHLSYPSTATGGCGKTGTGQLPWQHTMPATVDADTAKHVLRDLVNTLKYMNEKDASTMGAKSNQDYGGTAAIGRSRLVGDNAEYPITPDLVTHALEDAGMDHLPEKLVQVPDNVRSGDVRTMEQNGRFHERDNARDAVADVSRATTVELVPGQTEARGCPKESQIGNGENEFVSDSVGKFQEYPHQEAEKQGQKLPVKGMTTPDGRTGDQYTGEKSPVVKRKKKKVSQRSSGRGRGEGKKRPLWEQQRVLKYLVMELKTATERREDLEVERLFEELFHTLEELPMLTMDRDTQTEIAMALQPLRSENAGLRRKLRIANHQAKEVQRQAEAKLEEKQPSFEVITLQTLNTTLQQQLATQQEESGLLRNRVGELQRELTTYTKRCEEMERALELKDGAHLRSQGDWMTEMASLRKQLTGSKQEVESLQWKLGSLKRENDFLSKGLEETKASLGRTEETNQRLENVITRLAFRQTAESRRGNIESADPGSTDVPMSRRSHFPARDQRAKKTSPKRKQDWDLDEDGYGKPKVTRDRSTHTPSETLRNTSSLRGTAGSSCLPSPGPPSVAQTGSSILNRSLRDMLNQSARSKSPKVAFEATPLDDIDSFATRDGSNSEEPVISLDLGEHVREESRVFDRSSNEHSILTAGGSKQQVSDLAGKERELGLPRTSGLYRTLPSSGFEDFTVSMGANGPNLSVLGGVREGRILRQGKGNHSDTMSQASDSTASSVTSLFEAQFQLGLNNLDEKIAELQSNLEGMRK